MANNGKPKPIKKVLIVEDEESICRYLGSVLQRQDWQVLIAADCNQAMSLFVQECPQACIIDIHMPAGPDGMEILCRMKKVSPKTRCVMFTCDDDEVTAESARTAGADGYFAKPLDSTGIKRMVKALEG